MADEEEIETPEVEIEEPEGEAEVSVQPAVPDGLEELKRQIESERAGRLEAERLAREASQEARVAKTEKAGTDIQLVESSIKTLEGNTEQLKASLKTAYAGQDWDTVAEIQQSMAETAANLLQLRNGLTALKSKPKIEPMPRTVDPVEALAANLSPRSADWIRDHPQFARDPRLTRKMVRAHEDALDEGLSGDTPAYFEFVETRLGLRQQQEPDGDAMSEAAAPVRSRGSPPAAPVSRGVRRGGVMTLSAAEKEMAEAIGMSLEDYAKNKALDQKEKRIN